MFKEKIPCCYFPTKIIIVDDNEDFSSNLSLAFGTQFRCESFSSSKQALAYLQSCADSMKSLFTKHMTVSAEHTNPEVLSIDVNIASLCSSVLHSQDMRFERPVVLIIDYSMPEMNGLELCQQLSDLPYQKIVLTGEADNDFAVEAFNQGKIERFVRKGEFDYLEKLSTYVQELNISYFNQLSQNMFDMLNTSGQNLLYHQKFIDIFNQIVSEYNIIEFYLIDDTGSYLLLDQKGSSVELIVRTEEDMQSFVELAEDDNAEEVASVIRQRQKMPHMLVWEDRLSPTSNWHLYDVNTLQINGDTYYYSIVADTHSDHSPVKQNPVSYYQYISAS